MAVFCLLLFMFFVGLYLMIGFMVADLTREDWSDKRKGRTVLFWPWVLIKVAYNSIRGMKDGWEW